MFVYPDAGGDSTNIVDRPDQPGVSRHHHRDPDAYLIGDKLPDGFKTPFDQTRALAKLRYKYGKKKCYRVCRSDCEAAMSKVCFIFNFNFRDGDSNTVEYTWNDDVFCSFRKMSRTSPGTSGTPTRARARRRCRADS